MLLNFKSIAFFWGGPERFATPCCWLQPFPKSFMTSIPFGWFRPIVVVSLFLYMLYTLLLCYGHCGVTTRSCGFASLVYGLCYGCISFSFYHACLCWLVLGCMRTNPWILLNYTLNSSISFKLSILRNEWNKLIFFSFLLNLTFYHIKTINQLF